ncbi:MAG: hydantoinase/oxoprolinase family protein [Chloroflexota bacterium]|nr:hydantoinase/oxoprolinase family protein [Chloroflexota bacterium]
MTRERLAIDVGGTFVDFVALDEDTGDVRIEKSPSFGSLEARFFEGIDSLALDLTALKTIIHGSTMVINTIVQEKGARVGLITTRGFRDVLELGRGNREEIYNLFYRPPAPLVERYMRFEVSERLDARGRVVKPLDELEARAAIRQLKAAGVEGIAVVFLHSYVNPLHEERMRELVEEECPDIAVTVSSQICREWREFERTSTTVLNAYTKPKLARYLSALESELARRQFDGALSIMQSSGGITSLPAAREGPIRTIASGPAGGVIGAAALGRQLAQGNLVAADVGGTTFDVALITDGKPLEQTEHRINRRPVLQPTIDIVSIGAGGGSVAWLDAAGGLNIGPRSVEADPGPACFDLGGDEATVTDAQLLLGYLDPDYYLGERMRLSKKRAEDAIQERVASPLAMSALDAAAGIVHLANMNMAYAIRNITIERGHDPREFALVCYGGGGGLFAGFLLNELGAASAIIPQNPATFSAWGLLNADFREDMVRTCLKPFADLTARELRAELAALESEVRGRFAANGIGPVDTALALHAAMRYFGQEHTVKVPILNGDLGSDLLALRRRFDEYHEQAYSLKLPASAAEIVNLQVSILGITGKPVLKRIEVDNGKDSLKCRRNIAIRGYDGRMSVNVHDRARLGSGRLIKGPAIIEEWTSTALILPDQSATVDDYGNLIIKRGTP